MMSKSFLSVDEAAALLGLKPRRVRAMCEAQELMATKVGMIWVVDAESVEQERAWRVAYAKGMRRVPSRRCRPNQTPTAATA